MDDNNSNKYIDDTMPLDDINLKDIFIDSVREAVSSLDIPQALITKYKLLDGLGDGEIMDRSDDGSFENFASYGDWLEGNYPGDDDYYESGGVKYYKGDVNISADDYLPDRGDDYDDYNDDYDTAEHYAAFCSNVIDDVAYSSVQDIKLIFRDKLLDTCMSEYEKRYGGLPPFCEALKNFDSLSKSGWFDDISDNNCDCDPNVKARIKESIDDCFGRGEGRGIYCDLLVDYSLFECIRQRCSDDDFAMSDRERESCENLLEWCQETLRDDIRKSLTNVAMSEVSVSLYDNYGEDAVYRAFFENDLSAYYQAGYYEGDPDSIEYIEGLKDSPIPKIDELVARFRDDILAMGGLDGLEAKTDGVVRFSKGSDNDTIRDLTNKAVESFVSDKKHWDSPKDLVASSLVAYCTDEYIDSICDGSYKSENTPINFRSKFERSPGYIYPSDELYDPIDCFDRAGYFSAKAVIDDVRKDMTQTLKNKMSAGGDFDADKLMRKAFDADFKPSPDFSPMENLFIALCDQYRNETSHRYNYAFSSFDRNIVPVYGHNVDFDDIARVGGSTDIKGLTTLRSLKDGMNAVFARIENMIVGNIVDGAMAARFGFDIKNDLYDYCYRNPQKDNELIPAIKGRIVKESPLPNALQNALDNLNNTDGDDDRQFD